MTDFTQPMRMPDARPMLHGGLTMSQLTVVPLTPEEVKERTARMVPTVVSRAQRIRDLEAENAALRQQVAILSRAPTRRGDHV